MPDPRRLGRPAIDMTDARCGQLRVLSRDRTTADRLAAWRVRCDCGHVFVASGAHLRNGKVWRCRGCANRAQSISRRGHGETGNYLYRIWIHIRRCHRVSPHEWTPTGRGAPLCEPWAENYGRFAADIRASIGERPSALYNLVLASGADEFSPATVRWCGRGDWMTKFGRAKRTRALPPVRLDRHAPG